MAAKQYWSSGETCEVVGRYHSNCCCGQIKATFVASDIFPACKDCGKKLKWYRSFAETLPINTFETPAGSRKQRIE